MLKGHLERAVKDFRAARIHIANAYISDGADVRQLRMGFIYYERNVDYIDTDIAHALLTANADVDFRSNAEGRTPLLSASDYYYPRCGEIDAVLTLLNAKAEVDLADRQGRTPLHLSSSRSNTHVLRALLNANANAKSINTFMGT